MALAELVAIFGNVELEQVAQVLGKRLHVGPPTKKVDLADLCRKYALVNLERFLGIRDHT